MDLVLVLSFLLCMGVFAMVGLASVRVKQDTTDDYLIAGRGMHPGLAALSAVSTWNSGYMFIGAVGYTYLMGYSVIWLSIASAVGQLIAWAWLYKFIQDEANGRDVRSLTSLVSDVNGSPEARLAALLSVVLLSVYAAAQLTSGGKALFVMMGWSELIGIFIGFILVVAYCYAGGIRASIWTDAAQSCAMIVGSLILCWVALGEVGGIGGLHANLRSQDPSLTSFYPPGLKFGFSLWILGFLLGGLSVAGQPQVVSRVMTLGTDKDRKQAMAWFFVWQTPFYVFIAIIGLASRAVFSEANFDPELGLPMLAMELLPSFLVGLLLASVFAATMSTADSQVLACTAAVTDDIRPDWSQDHRKTKLVTLVVAVFATLIAIGGQYIPGGNNVFGLVILAVYGLGSIFIPLLIVRWAGYQTDSQHAITMMIAAVSGVILWRVLDWNMEVFESVPGMFSAFAAHFISNQIRSPGTSPFGRFELPDSKKIVAVTTAFILPLGAVEVSYLLASPASYDGLGGVGDYSVHLEVEAITVMDGVEFVNDGDRLELLYTWELLQFSEGFEIAAFELGWFWNETDEAADPNGVMQQISCTVDPGENLLDSTTGFYSHGESAFEQVQDAGLGLVGEEFWSGIGWAAEASDNLSETQGGDILVYNFSKFSEQELQHHFSVSGIHPGEYSMSIQVDVQVGGTSGCPHSDGGEEISYSVRVKAHKFSIEPS